MALTNCRECQGEVSTEARSCPHCGVPNPSNRPPHPEERAGVQRTETVEIPSLDSSRDFSRPLSRKTSGFMEPGGYFSTACQIGALAGFVFGILMFFTGNSPQEAIFLGAFFGVAFGLIMAAFFKGETISLPFQNRETLKSASERASSGVGASS